MQDKRIKKEALKRYVIYNQKKFNVEKLKIKELIVRKYSGITWSN